MIGSELWLHVELTAGMGLFEQTAREMCELANRMQINITADWNGCHMIALPNLTTPDQLLASYDAWAKRKSHA